MEFDLYKLIQKQIEQKNKNIKDIRCEVELDGHIDIGLMIEPRIIVTFEPTPEGFEASCELQFEYDVDMGIEEYIRYMELILEKKSIIYFANAISIDINFMIAKNHMLSHVVKANFALTATPEFLKCVAIQMTCQLLSTYICLD